MASDPRCSRANPLPDFDNSCRYATSFAMPTPWNWTPRDSLNLRRVLVESAPRLDAELTSFDAFLVQVAAADR